MSDGLARSLFSGVFDFYWENVRTRREVTRVAGQINPTPGLSAGRDLDDPFTLLLRSGGAPKTRPAAPITDFSAGHGRPDRVIAVPAPRFETSSGPAGARLIPSADTLGSSRSTPRSVVGARFFF